MSNMWIRSGVAASLFVCLGAGGQGLAEGQITLSDPVPLSDIRKDLSGTCGTVPFAIELAQGRTRSSLQNVHLSVDGRSIAEPEVNKILATIQPGQHISDAALSECMADEDAIRVKGFLVLTPPRPGASNGTFEFLESIINRNGQVSDVAYN
jgi:hypothetical protein